MARSVHFKTSLYCHAHPQVTQVTLRIVMFTCLCCNIAFPSHTEQRACISGSPRTCSLCTGDHYRADLHRYNLKRRVAGLAPLSAAVFAQKLTDRTQESPPQSSFHCDTCEYASPPPPSIACSPPTASHTPPRMPTPPTSVPKGTRTTPSGAPLGPHNSQSSTP